MNHDQFEQYISEMKQHIADTIRVTVNGKIDSMRHDLADYMEKDKEWKRDAQSVIDMGRNVSGFGKVALYVFGFVVAAGGAWLVVKGFIKQ